MSRSVEERARVCMEDLRKIRNDRGAMAELRRGFSEATASYAWPYLARWCDLENDRERTIVQTVAAAFAMYPEEGKGSFGEVLRIIAISGKNKKSEALKSFEGKFHRLLICEKPEEVCTFLPGLIRAAKQKNVSINFEQLLVDLFYWPGRTREKWAKAFWSDEATGTVEDE